MKSNSGGIDVLTYAAAVSKSKKNTDSQISTINSEIDGKADKSDLDGLKFTHLTETEYNSLEVRDSGTVYFIS